jgi:hypothetical protein
MKFGKTFLILKNNNDVTIGNDQANITITAAGVMTLHAQSIKINTPANSFTLETHRHTQPPDGHGDSESPTNLPLAGS